ncbi:MAG: hypothetical protein WD771_10430 [Gemmatimonadaceae bacterium]
MAEYDALERAITDGARILVQRRGTDFLVIPQKLAVIKGREAIHARHPSTGAALVLYLDEADRVTVVR